MLKYFSAGISLIEILIALVLVSIVFLMGVSGFQHITMRTLTDSYVSQIIAEINFARAQAIKYGQPAIFCGSSDLKKCDGHWREGQIILMNKQVTRVYQALPFNNQLYWSSSLGKDAMLEILPTGFTNGQNGTFDFCPQDKRYAKRIIINQAGRIRVTAENVHC